MTPSKKQYKTIDEYCKTFPKDIQVYLRVMRETIREAAPAAEEKISYQIPTFSLHGNLVHFAAWKSHIGLYPASSGVKTFEKELAKYEVSKGAIRFLIGKPLPVTLIRRIVKFRVKENKEKMKQKCEVKKK